ncbi:MAG: DUF4339 domain-containing protein [Chlamydiales bacterium]|nr:DUF4339 domain-containing protein [Chlamydiales bacterium]
MLFGILGLTALFLLPPIPSTIGLKKKPPPLVFPSLQILDSFQNSTIWYYLDKEHNQLGPMSFEGISKAWEEGKIDRISYVWNERMENWKRLHEVVQPEN